MTSWTAGYVSDIAYTHGFYKEMNPHLLSLASLVRGDASAMRTVTTYCELGCGQGFTANLLAAANPQIEFYATDFNPTQIVGAKILAESAGTQNVKFFDQSFQQFLNEPSLPQFDVISLHGIYSWISVVNRRSIIDFIDRRLKPGGLVYISYNALPGWAAAMPMRRLLVDHAASATGPIGPRIESAIAFADALKSLGSGYFPQNPSVGPRLDKLKSQNRNYLAHEYFNRDWTPFYFGDVSADMADAKLSFVGSAHILDNVNAINLLPEHQELLETVGNPSIRETVRDYLVNQQFRRDVFARGPLPLGQSETTQAWLDSRFVLSSKRDEIPLTTTGALGEATLQADVYEPILDALAAIGGAISLRQLLKSDQKVADLGWPRLQQAIVVLAGAGHIQPCPKDTKAETKRRESTRRFNQAVMARAQFGAELQCLASPVTGGGLAVDRIHQLFLLALGRKESDPVDFVFRILNEQGQRIVKDGETLQTPDENRNELTNRYRSFEERLPTFKALGLI